MDRSEAGAFRFGSIGGWVLFLFVIGIGCELGARLDDKIFDGTPLLAAPSYEALFTTNEKGLRQGRPHARWKQVSMNNVGMRGADVEIGGEKKCSRWMFLGASETFGEPSVKDMEYPQRLAKLAHSAGRCVEILNTAFPGLHPAEFAERYREFQSHYKPDLVFIYPSVQLYLGHIPDGANKELPLQENKKNQGRASLLKSRFLERLKDSLEVPQIVQTYRVRRWIQQATDGKPADWMFTAPPKDRLDMFATHIQDTVSAVRASGAEPILMTHAIRATSPPRAEDSADLFAMRVYTPRASESALAAFEYAAAERVRQLAGKSRARLVDVSRLVGGNRGMFIDLVHFSPVGHEYVAKKIFDNLEQQRTVGE